MENTSDMNTVSSEQTNKSQDKRARVLFCSKGNHIPDKCLVFVYDYANVLPGYDPIEEPEAVLLDSCGKVIGWESSKADVPAELIKQAENEQEGIICPEHLCYCEYREAP